VSYVRSRLTSFQAAMPTYPAAAFGGRGLVTVGGGMRYIIPAWIMVHQLRHLGGWTISLISMNVAVLLSV
jgi:hypothetical protein